jgi:hypothetical protein
MYFALETLETEFVSRASRLHHKFGDTRCTIQVEDRNLTSTGNLIVRISPLNDLAAPIIAQVTQSGVLISAGKGAVFEVPNDSACLEKSEAICLSIMSGHFEENVWFESGTVMGATGKVLVRDECIEDSWSRLTGFKFWKKKHTQHLVYQHY